MSGRIKIKPKNKDKKPDIDVFKMDLLAARNIKKFGLEKQNLLTQ